MRIDKHGYYLNIADAVSWRSTCLRRLYGAVIVKGDEIIATGYNGAPRGQENCCDIGECTRMKLAIPHGERYELCRSVHAEANAIISAPRDKMFGATLYLSGFDAENGKAIAAVPCAMCERLIVNAGISEVIARFAGKHRCISYTVYCVNEEKRLDLVSIGESLYEELGGSKC